MISPGEHISIFGITGCGKSTLTRQVAGLFYRRVIFDRLSEWNRIPGSVTVPDFTGFKREYQRLYQLDTFTIIVRPPAGISPEALVELTNDVMSLIYRVEKYHREGIGIIFEEVWLYAPLHNVPTWFRETLFTGRHYKISIVGNAQRPASVSKDMVSQSRHVFIGQFFEARDRKYYRDSLGDLPELEKPPAKYEFLWHRAGEQSQRIKVNN